MQSKYFFALSSCMTKVFADEKPVCREELTIRAFQGERAAWQLVYFLNDTESRGVPVFPLDVALQGYPGRAHFYTVELMPSDYPAHPCRDEAYLRTQPGLYPDLLRPLPDGKNACSIRPIPGQYRAVWIALDTTGVAPGEYWLNLKIAPRKEAVLGRGLRVYNEEPILKEVLPVRLLLSGAKLPEQRLIHSEWFHPDSLLHYYHCEAFSELHWTTIEAYMRAAKAHAVNLLPVPVFTPPINTAIGKARLSIQLCRISRDDYGRYAFDFSRLKRYLALGRRLNFPYLEMPHFFTPWGAKACPQIVAEIDGVEEPVFGWGIEATHPAYALFLEQFIPALRRELDTAGYPADKVFWHVSDEPSRETIYSYRKARALLLRFVPEEQLIDAVSDFTLYDPASKSCPVAANDRLEAFLDAGVRGLWTYYGSKQCADVPNRFFSMPAGRTRIMGVLLYYFKIRGFLHWGFNFYNSQFSHDALNPYAVTDAGKAYPSGDAFLAYPGPPGEVYSSLRAEVQDAGLYDLRALEAAEQKVGRKEVLDLLEELAGGALSFTHYPWDEGFFARLRQRLTEILG